MKSCGLVEQRVVSPETGIVAYPKLGGMEVAQNGGQSSHVVGVGVGEGHYVQAANSARPQHLGDDLLADVIVLGGLMRASAVAAAIHQQGLTVGRNQQNGVALAHVDGLDEQGVAGVIDGTGQDGNDGGQKQRGPCSAAGPAGSG